jgi:hypothetical protein
MQVGGSESWHFAGSSQLLLLQGFVDAVLLSHVS